LAVAASVVSAFNKVVSLKTQKTPNFGAALSKYAVEHNKYVPLEIHNNHPYILKARQSNPCQNVNRTGPKSLVSEVGHPTATLKKREYAAK
jgi:hypothetical protein